MGEDRTTCCEKKPNDVIATPCRHRHSSVISSCSEDAETESTSTGYPQSPDEEKEEELEYGPGIVNKLRTRFLSITLKQNRGINSMRRSCSMENLLDQDRPCKSLDKNLGMVNGGGVQTSTPWGNLKKAKSMDSLLMEMQQPSESPSMKDLHLETNGESKKIPRIVKNRENGLSRLCDEELPKPDTVKTYKRMFEPAESRRGSHCRRPPVLRASAKACERSKINGVATNPSAKVNGVTAKGKSSAKQSPPVKAQSSPESAPAINGNVKKPAVVNGEPSRPLYNGCHIVKASPVKINNSALKNGKDVEKNLNSINRLMNKKEVHFSNKADVIINGNGCHSEILKIKTNDEAVKQFNNKPVVNNMIVNGNMKPKVPSNRPSLRSPKPILNKPEEQKLNDKIIPPKLKPKLTNGLKKPFEVVERKIAPAVPPREVVPKISEENKSKVEAKSPESEKEEFKFLSDEEKKDIPELLPENKINGDIPPTVENNPQKEVKIPHEDKPPQSPTEPKIIKEDIKPLVKEIPKINERTVQSDPKTITNNNKLTKAPAPVKPENGQVSNVNSDKSKPETVQQDTTEVKRDFKPVKKQKTPPQTTSIVFDFRGKDVVPHVAVMPTPFGCKSLHPKKRPAAEGKDVPNGVAASDDEDEDYVDYSVPPPCGVIFEGENVKIGRGSILATRNKDLKITFDDDVDGNTFVYPSETSLLEDMDRSLSPATPPENEIIPNGQPPPASSKLKTNTSIGNSSAGGLSTYTPSVLRTVDNFEPGMFRPSSAPPDKEDEKSRNSEEEENKEVRDEHAGDASADMLKPADPDLISSWSLSAGTSDLLF